MRAGIDYAPETDRRGRPVFVGDYVSFKRYPRGTGRGYVVVSKRALTEHEGRMLPALAILDDGETYAFYSSGVLLLKPLSPERG